jgi:hypothetical protein
MTALFFKSTNLCIQAIQLQIYLHQATSLAIVPDHESLPEYVEGKSKSSFGIRYDS